MSAQTDRELLELAAKAAGLDAQYSENMGDFSIGEPYSRGEVRWNPLTDDGDAFRLAMQLRINIEHLITQGNQPYGVNCWPNGRGDCASISTDLDEYAEGSRRAIVRAAAAITQGA